MKKVISFLIFLLFTLTALYPAGSLIASCFGYNFKLMGIPVFAVSSAIISICIVILDGVYKIAFNKLVQILLAVITPISLINVVLCAIESPQTWTIAGTLVSTGCCAYLMIKNGEPLLLKILSGAVSAFMFLPVCLMCFLSLVFGDFGLNTVIETIESPSGKYYVQVVDSDQGALGGDTFVDVYKPGEVNLFLFKFEKQTQRVYHGEWREYENMQIYWKDDSCLVINSVEYEIE